MCSNLSNYPFFKHDIISWRVGQIELKLHCYCYSITEPVHLYNNRCLFYYYFLTDMSNKQFTYWIIQAPPCNLQAGITAHGVCVGNPCIHQLFKYQLMTILGMLTFLLLCSWSPINLWWHRNQMTDHSNGAGCFLAMTGNNAWHTILNIVSGYYTVHINHKS